MFTTETLKIKRQFSMNHLIEIIQSSWLTSLICIAPYFKSVIFGYTALNSILGPFIFQNTLRLSAVQYGYVALSLVLAWTLGNLTNRLLFDVNQTSKVLVSLIVQTIMIVALITFSYLDVITVASFFIPLLIIIFCAAVMFSLFVSESLSQFPDLAASSNAFLFATTWIGFGVYTFYATSLPVNNVMPLSLTFLFVNGICYLLMKKIKSQ